MRKFSITFFSAIRAEVITFMEGFTASSAKCTNRCAMVEINNLWCGNVFRLINSVVFVMSQRCFAFRTVNESIGVPRTETQRIIGISYNLLTFLAGLHIYKSAVPVRSFVAHKSLLLSLGCDEEVCDLSVKSHIGKKSFFLFR